MGDGKETWTVLSLIGLGHLGDSCTWSRECGIDGCKDRHYRLLHEEKVAPGFI